MRKTGVRGRRLLALAVIALAFTPSAGMGQVNRSKNTTLPDLTAATEAAQRALDSPVDLQVQGPDIEAALSGVARTTGVSIRIDLPTLMGRRVTLSDPASPRLKGDTLRSALQQLFVTPTALADRPVPVSSHEGAIQIDAFRWNPYPRGGSYRKGSWVVNGKIVDEAGNPVPRAGVRLYCWAWVMLTSADDHGRFFATLPTNGKLEVEAWDERGDRRGWVHVGHESGSDARAYWPTVTLKSPRRVSVHVSGTDWRPTQGARVVLIGGGYPYDGPLTAPTGESNFQIPADLDVEAVIAWKHGAGLDYVASREFGTLRGSGEPLLAADQPVQLQLSQRPTVQFRILDQFDRPVVRNPLDPWVLKKPGSGADFNLTHLHARETQLTDANGVVSFDWLPGWQQDNVSFAGGASSCSRAEVDFSLQEVGPNPQTIRVERMATVRGRIFGVDGKPARDVFVIARGGGFQKSRHYSNGIANNEGRFEFAVPAQQSYLFVAMSRDGKMISAPEERIVEDVNREIDDIDLYLRPGIRVSGRLEPRRFLADDTQPVLRLVGDDLNTWQDVKLPNDGSLTPVRAADEIQLDWKPGGQFSVLVGPGRYEFSPGKDARGIPFELTEQTEYEVQIPPN